MFTRQTGHSCRVLLANNAERYSLGRLKVQQMPTIWECEKCPSRAFDEHNFTLAILHIWNRHNGPPTQWYEAGKIPSRHYWLFHEVGGSRTSCSHNGGQDTTLCVEESCLPIWDSTNHYLRQWMTIRSRKFRDFYKELGIRNHYSSPGHLQANGQTEVTNLTLLKLIKTWLEKEKGV